MTFGTEEGEHLFVSAVTLLQTSFVYKKKLPIMQQLKLKCVLFSYRKERIHHQYLFSTPCILSKICF